MIKTVPGKRSRGKQPRVVAHVAAILYGPEELGDQIGAFLDRCKLFLQEPFGCEQNVPYKNPHCLSSIFEEPKMTFELKELNVTCATLSQFEPLKALETTDDLPEWSQPSSFKTNVILHK